MSVSFCPKLTFSACLRVVLTLLSDCDPADTAQMIIYKKAWGYPDQRLDRPGAMILETKLGQILSQTLTDRSRVTLEADSALRVGYDGQARTLTLEKGNVRFEVAHEKRPFIVRAGKGSVTARGTIFEVAMLRQPRHRASGPRQHRRRVEHS